MLANAERFQLDDIADLILHLVGHRIKVDIVERSNSPNTCWAWFSHSLHVIATLFLLKHVETCWNCFISVVQAPSVAACQKQTKRPCAAAGPPARLAPTCAVLIKSSVLFFFPFFTVLHMQQSFFCSKTILTLWDLNGLDGWVEQHFRCQTYQEKIANSQWQRESCAEVLPWLPSICHWTCAKSCLPSHMARSDDGQMYQDVHT